MVPAIKASEKDIQKAAPTEVVSMRGLESGMMASIVGSQGRMSADARDEAVDWATVQLQCAYRCHIARRRAAAQKDRRAKIETVTSSELARYV